MNNKQVFNTEDEIKKWANTTVLRRIGSIYAVKHFRSGLFHILTPCQGGWSEAMTSVDLKWLEE